MALSSGPPVTLAPSTAVPSGVLGATTSISLRPLPHSDPSHFLAEISANNECHSELSGFDSEMMTTEEMNEILESRNKSLVEHTLLLSNNKLTKWTKEMNR